MTTEFTPSPEARDALEGALTVHDDLGVGELTPGIAVDTVIEQGWVPADEFARHVAAECAEIVLYEVTRTSYYVRDDLARAIRERFALSVEAPAETPKLPTHHVYRVIDGVYESTRCWCSATATHPMGQEAPAETHTVDYPDAGFSVIKVRPAETPKLDPLPWLTPSGITRWSSNFDGEFLFAPRAELGYSTRIEDYA